MDTILVIEDEKKLLRTLVDFLRMNEYTVLEAADGLEGLRQFRQHSQEIDLVLLDLMLPFAGGMEILKEIRMRSNLPVIVLSAKETVEDQLKGFAHGADDYITKPYSLAVVKAHIEAVLKRSGQKAPSLLRVGAISLDVEGRRALVNGRNIDITPKEYELLEYFCKNLGRVLTREQILDQLWGIDYDGDIRTIDTMVKQLRKKIGDPSYIRTVYGVGYCFKGEQGEQ